MRDDVRKTKTIFLTMVVGKLLLHGGVNGLFQTLIINYEITGAICLEAVILVFFTPVVINVWFCAISLDQTSLRLPNSEAQIINTGCPKTSFLSFLSMYFSMIGLGKQII